MGKSFGAFIYLTSEEILDGEEGVNIASSRSVLPRRLEQHFLSGGSWCLAVTHIQRQWQNIKMTDLLLMYIMYISSQTLDADILFPRLCLIVLNHTLSTKTSNKVPLWAELTKKVAVLFLSLLHKPQLTQKVCTSVLETLSLAPYLNCPM